MTDYLQDTEKMFFDELVDAKLVARSGEILNPEKYVQWLRQKKDNIYSQLRDIPEPGDVYDRYKANLLMKDIGIIDKMLQRQIDPTPSAAQRKLQNREKELIEQKSLFTRAMEILRRR